MTTMIGFEMKCSQRHAARVRKNPARHEPCAERKQVSRGRFGLTTSFFVNRNRPHWHALRKEKSSARHEPCIDGLVGWFTKERLIPKRGGCHRGRFDLTTIWRCQIEPSPRHRCAHLSQWITYRHSISWVSRGSFLFGSQKNRCLREMTVWHRRVLPHLIWQSVKRDGFLRRPKTIQEQATLETLLHLYCICGHVVF